MIFLSQEKGEYGGENEYGSRIKRLAVATKASSVARSLKLTNVDLGYYLVTTWMGQGRPSAVNLCPFVGVDLNL